MKFVLEVDIETPQDKDRTVTELGRILRYWGGNLHHYDLKPGDGSAVHDSAHREVGNWKIAS
ncbi:MULTISPECIES: hypothetical protein [unclassified Streptomyces]|uniref:hypothetical protein n=1 Tax=unclassified Streptomyces TaxID=2593676 RepID=UPI002DDA57E2|nr:MULTISPECIES: hypothetical protein [unclassified Streptomyces]WSA90959.1 hypothetical protein OIE63_04945 [Streptomyces sp. NBC_01795]WSB75284.1 hypothetical protein OHB04_05485 [Streptomyces sp. NBC_01775]WSS45251.1 hypothetical protein OG220_35100 [Streptomyces sp. NBC_01187]